MELKSKTISDNYSEKILHRQFDLLLHNDNKLIKKNNIDNTIENKRDINWGEYYFQIGQKTNGRGIGNPEMYDKLYIGENTRLNPTNENIRETDIHQRTTIPLDSFHINYGNLDYLNESRGGISSRTYKKVNSN